MSAEFHKPVRLPSETMDRLFEGEDPAEAARAAHATAAALLAHVRDDAAPEVVERVVGLADRHGIGDMAALWSRSPARSLPGALWRLYLLQMSIHDGPQMAAVLYERGRQVLRSAEPVVAGVPVAASPDELVSLVDTILRGAFVGDFADALDRAAAFSRVQAVGATHLADDDEPTAPERGSLLTRRALRLSTVAEELTAAARLWRTGDLS